MSITIVRGDARDLPLPDDSADLIVTSPPYFGLRSYTDGGQHYDQQLGAEATSTDFVDALIACTREMVRVLKPSGSIWVNLGDKYGPNKSLRGLPWRYALRCTDDLGLILRAEVIWSKPNGLPESVRDRVRRSHEQWFHFTLQPRYYSAVDEIREPHKRHWSPGNNGGHSHRIAQAGVNAESNLDLSSPHPLGKLPGSVWTIATEPLRVPPELGVDHFAAFPSEWPRRLILGWSPREVCTVCGEGRRPVVNRTRTQTRKGIDAIRGANDGSVIAMSGGSGFGQRAETTSVITGYACACPDTTATATPGVVLDPFGGTGTTAHVADALGRHGISVDLSADYCRLAEHPHLRDKRAAKVRKAGA